MRELVHVIASMTQGGIFPVCPINDKCPAPNSVWKFLHGTPMCSTGVVVNLDQIIPYYTMYTCSALSPLCSAVKPLTSPCLYDMWVIPPVISDLELYIFEQFLSSLWSTFASAF